MSQPRKTLLDAMPSPEVIAILRDAPKPKTPILATAENGNSTALPATLPQMPQPRQKPRDSKEFSRKARLTNAVAKEEREVRVPFSCRVPSNVVQAILKVSGERKLERIQPFTLQDITTEALTKWLHSSGYRLHD